MKGPTPTPTGYRFLEKCSSFTLPQSASPRQFRRKTCWIIISVVLMFINMASDLARAAKSQDETSIRVAEAEGLLTIKVRQRLVALHRPDDELIFERIISLAHSYAEKRCRFLRTVFEANGSNGDDLKYPWCVEGFPIGTFTAMAEFGDLRIGQENVPKLRSGLCPAESPENCPEPPGNQDFQRHTLKMEAGLRDQVQQHTSVFAQGSDVQKQEMRKLFEQSQSELAQLVDQSCSFAISLEQERVPTWALESCKTQQRNWTIYLSFGMLHLLTEKSP